MALDYKYGNLTIEQKNSFDSLNQKVSSFFNIVQTSDSNQTTHTSVEFINKFPHAFNDPYYLRYISCNKNILNALENITNGYIYFLFDKYQIVLDLHQFSDINYNNIYYLYTHFKNELSLEQLNQINHLSRNVVSDSHLSGKNKDTPSFLLQISKLLNVSPSLADFSDIEHIISEKSLEKYHEMILTTNNRLTIDTIIANEDFFLDYYLFNDVIKEDIFLCAQFTLFDIQKVTISDPLFDLIALPLSLNNHFSNHPEFKNRFFGFLQLNLHRLLIKYESLPDNTFNDNEMDDVGAGDFLIQLLQNFVFEDNEEHFKFLSTLIYLVKRENPNNFYQILNFLKFDTPDPREIIFKLIFPLISKNATSSNLIVVPDDFAYILEQQTLVNNKDFIRDVLFDELQHLIQAHSFTNQSPYRIYSKYNELFNFDYQGVNFKDCIFNNDFFHQLVSLKFNDLNVLLNTTFDRHLLILNNKALNKENYFLSETESFFNDFQIYSLILEKIKEYFQDFFNYDKELHEIVLGILPHIHKIKKNGLLKNFMNILHDCENEKIQSFYQEFSSTLKELNIYCSSYIILQDNDIASHVSLKNIDYSMKNVNLYIELDSLSYLHADNYLQGNSIGVFDPQYFEEHKQHIQENLITNFLYVAQDTFSKSFEIRPPEKILANMMPPIPPKTGLSPIPPALNSPGHIISHTTLNNISHIAETLSGVEPAASHNEHSYLFQFKRFELSLDNLFITLFKDHSLLKNSRIQRFLLVYFFNNQTFEFLSKDNQNILKKELNLFLFKNYSFSNGYNFNDENIRVDFGQEYKIVAEQRNVCIKTSYLLSSSKFAAQSLIDDSFIFKTLNYLPYSRLNFINTHIVPLIKLLYLNICAIFDFKISTQKTPAYNSWFNNISKVLLMELFETNFQHFNQKDLDVTDTLNYLFSKHQSINIQKFKLYPEISKFLETKHYMFNEDNDVNLINFKQIKHNQGFKKFFVLFLFMADDNIVSKVIETFYNQHQLHVLHDLFLQNNILFNLNPQIFSKNILEKTFSFEQIQEYMHQTTELTFFDKVSSKDIGQPNVEPTSEYQLKPLLSLNESDLSHYFHVVANTSLLYKYGFLDKKLSLHPVIENNFREFLKIFFAIKNPLVDNNYQWFVDIFDINFDIIKDYLVEDYPSIFLFPHKEQPPPHTINKHLLLSKEQMLQALKNIATQNNSSDIFIKIKNSESFTLWLQDYSHLQFTEGHVNFAPEYDSSILFNDVYHYESDVTNHLNESLNPEDLLKQNIFLYLWNNLQDAPIIRLSLINFSLILNVFNSLINFQEPLSKHFQLSIENDACYPESIKSLYDIDPANKYSYTAYHIYYHYICSKLNFTREKLMSDIKYIEHQTASYYSHNKQDYLRNSFQFFHHLLSSFGALKNKNYIRCNIFLLPINFLSAITHYYCSERDNIYFMFLTDCIVLPHENTEKSDLKNSLFEKIISYSSSIDLYQNFSSFQTHLSSNSNGNFPISYYPLSEDNTNLFFEFLLLVMYKNSHEKTEIISLIQFILFHLIFSPFLFSTYTINIYQMLLHHHVTQEFINFYKQEKMFIELDSISKDDNSKKITHTTHKKKI